MYFGGGGVIGPNPSILVGHIQQAQHIKVNLIRKEVTPLFFFWCVCVCEMN